MSNLAVVEQLREKIRKLEAQPRSLLLSLRTGWAELDDWGVFRLGGGVELCGEEGSGRTTVALSVVAACAREKRLSAWVDGPQELYPPAAHAMGVELRRLLIVRPPTSKKLVWVAVQLLRSGAFTCVVLDVTHTNLKLTMIDTKKLLDAARTGGSLLILLTSLLAPGQGLMRLLMKTVREPPSSASARAMTVVRLPESTCFELETPHGRRTRVGQRAWSGRRIDAPWGVPRPVAIVPTQSFPRPRRNVLRDGYPNWWGPGREGTAAVASSSLRHHGRESR